MLPFQENLPSSAPVRLELWGSIGLGDPVFLVLLPVVVLAVWFGRRQRSLASLSIPLSGVSYRVPKSLRQRLLFLPDLLEATACVLLVLALARPLDYNVVNSVTSEVVDTVLVVDRSSSMIHMDLEADRTRLDVVKDVVAAYAERRMTDEVGASDNVALLSFARYPELRCPFTLDVDALHGFLDDVNIVEYQEEDGTAIGAALTKSADLLSDNGAESSIIVLLTDGANTVDDILPEEGIRLAKENGVRVYTIHAERIVYTQVGRRVYPTEEEPDTTLLRRIASETGGRFYRAKDKDGLEQIYAEIEELERTPRVEERRVETRDLYPRILLFALGFALVGRALAAFGLRRTT
ncbi:MAG: Ca-activated chloride channel family protein [Bacteroidia bacterium]|jgi:Ca-activated chloride channel family protein